ncbi:MAG: hypothetical protein J6J71_07825 [Prevotella sp.]|nr:hypothetical protein [Prevotella sp.]
MLRYLIIFLLLFITTKNEAADYLTDYYRQVTSNDEIIEGREYIIVHKQNTNFNLIMGIYSSGNNIARVELHTNNLVKEMIPCIDGMGVYTLEKKENDDAWYIKDQQNRYLTYHSNADKFITANATATEYSRFGINIEANGEASINYLSSTGKKFTLQYDDKCFFIASPNSSYGKVCLYYKAKTMYGRPAITAGNYGTVCIPYSANANESNAEFYEITGKTVDGDNVSSIIITPVTTLAAGTPYIFLCEENALEMPYTGEAVTEPQQATGLVGSFTNVSNIPAGNYILSSNKIRKIAEGGEASIRQYRAYLSLDDVPELTGPLPAKAKSLHNANNTTSIKTIISSSTPQNHYYNLHGQCVSPHTKGIVIYNGKKYLNK